MSGSYSREVAFERYAFTSYFKNCTWDGNTVIFLRKKTGGLWGGLVDGVLWTNRERAQVGDRVSLKGFGARGGPQNEVGKGNPEESFFFALLNVPLKEKIL